MSPNPRAILAPFSLLVSLLFLGCTTPNEEGFTISGKIRGAQNTKIIVIKQADVARKRNEFIDSILLDADGRFEKTFDSEPNIYTLDFAGKKKLDLAIDKKQHIVIEGDLASLDTLNISGSPDTTKLFAYEKFRKESLGRLVISVRDDLKSIGKENDPEAEERGRAEIINYEKHRMELNDFIEREMDASIAIYATTLRWDGEQNLPLFESLASSFEKKHGDIEVTKRIKEKVDLIRATSVGGKVTYIEMPNVQGETITFKPEKAKVTLIDFWASWCGPCRRESRKLGALYEKYSAKGFEIYSISLDDDREKWVDALEKDERVWANVSTLKGFETKAAIESGVTALPAKFLIGADGNIVAKNLLGNDLEEKLAHLLSE